MVTTDREEWWSSIWSFKDHGKSWEAMHARSHPPGFRWVHESFGTNWRMTEIQAAIGRIQLQRLQAWTDARQRNAGRIAAACRRFRALRVPPVPADIQHAYYKFYAFTEPGELAPGWTRDRIIEAIVDRGVPCYPGSCSEIYLERAFDNSGYRPAERLPVARELGETSLMFLVHPTLTQAEIDKTCEVIAEVMESASRWHGVKNVSNA